MTTTATPLASAAIKTPREQFLEAYEREHATTMRVLRAYPPDKVDLKPHPKCKTARELAWMFVGERSLGKAGLANAFASGAGGGSATPPPPEKWEDLLTALEASHVDFRKTFESYSDDQLFEPIKFFGAPRTLVDYPRIDFAWFLLMDQIHHRGQMSIYLRMADAKVPSIYGPTADEPWM